MYDALLAELRLAEEVDYRNYLRMRPTDFEAILNLVAQDITKKDIQIWGRLCFLLFFLLLVEDILFLETNK